MRSSLKLFFPIVAAAFVCAAACGSEVIHTQGSDGGSGGAGGGTGGTVTSGDGGAPSCPENPPEGRCTEEGRTCGYPRDIFPEATCAEVFECRSYGANLEWYDDLVCDPPIVSCEEAEEGELCLEIGERCYSGGNECDSNWETRCLPNHRWEIGAPDVSGCGGYK